MTEKNTPRPIERGDRFEHQGHRDRGRVVQVREVLEGDRYRVVNDEAPKNTSTVGRHSTVSGDRLRSRIFRRVSR